MRTSQKIIFEGDFDLTANSPIPVMSQFRDMRRRIPSDVLIKFADSTLNVILLLSFCVETISGGKDSFLLENNTISKINIHL